MNPLSSVSWLWRAWRGRSITFAVLFAFGLLGVSVLGGFRQMLRHHGAPWYVWLILPMILFARLAWRETQWFPDPAVRKKWALRIVVGALVLWVAGVKLNSWHREEQDATAPATAAESGRADPHGR